MRPPEVIRVFPAYLRPWDGLKRSTLCFQQYSWVLSHFSRLTLDFEGYYRWARLSPLGQDPARQVWRWVAPESTEGWAGGSAGTSWADGGGVACAKALRVESAGSGENTSFAMRGPHPKPATPAPSWTVTGCPCCQVWKPKLWEPVYLLHGSESWYRKTLCFFKKKKKEFKPVKEATK